MANKKISELDSGSIPTDLDIIPIVDAETLSTKGTRASYLAAYITGSITQLDLNSLTSSVISGTTGQFTFLSASYAHISGAISSSVASGQNAIILPMGSRIYWGKTTDNNGSSLIYASNAGTLVAGGVTLAGGGVGASSYTLSNAGVFEIGGSSVSSILRSKDNGATGGLTIRGGTQNTGRTEPGQYVVMQGGTSGNDNYRGGHAYIYGGLANSPTGSGGAIIFKTAATGSGTTLVSRMTISPEGYVSIGDFSGSYPLDVSGTLNVRGGITASYVNSATLSGTILQLGGGSGVEAIQMVTGGRIRLGTSNQFIYGVSTNQININASFAVVASAAMQATSFGSNNATSTVWLRAGSSNSDSVLTSRTHSTQGNVGNTYVLGGVGTAPNIYGGHVFVQGGTTAGTAVGGSIYFQTAATGSGNTLVNRMMITSSGEIGIGTDNPTQLLDVYGNVNINNALTASIIKFSDGTTQTTAAGVGGSGIQGTGNIHRLAKFNGTASLDSAQISIDGTTNHITATGSLTVLSNLTASNANISTKLGIGIAAPLWPLQVNHATAAVIGATHTDSTGESTVIAIDQAGSSHYTIMQTFGVSAAGSIGSENKAGASVIYSTGTNLTKMVLGITQQNIPLIIMQSGQDRLRINGNGTTGETVINDSQGDYDTRIEGDTNENLFFTDASTDRVGIGTNSPAQLLDVRGNVNVNNALSASIIRFGDGTTQSTAATGGSGIQGSGNIHRLAKFNGTASLNSSEISIDGSTNHVTVTGSLTVLSNLTASNAAITGSLVVGTPLPNSNVKVHIVGDTMGVGAFISTNNASYAPAGSAFVDYSSAGGRIYNKGPDTSTNAAFRIDTVRSNDTNLVQIMYVPANVAEIVINEGSVDVNLRVEGNGDENLLFTDAGNDRVGIGTNSPQSQFQIGATSVSAPTGIGTFTLAGGDPAFNFQETDGGSDTKNWYFLASGNTFYWGLNNDAANSGANYCIITRSTNRVATIDFQAGSTPKSRLYINTTETVINENSEDLDLRVEGNGDENLLFADAGNDRVGIGTNAPNTRLEVSYTNTDVNTSHVRLNNASATGQTSLEFYINGSQRSKIRSDHAGNTNYISNGGDHYFYVGGESGVVRTVINSTGLSVGGNGYVSNAFTASVITGINPHLNIVGGLKVDGPLYGYSSEYTNLTASHTLSNGDNGKIVVINSAAETTLTAPTNLTGGFGISIIQSGAGKILVTGSLGVSVLNISSHSKTAGQYAVAYLTYLSGNAYVLHGSTTIG